MHVRCIQRMEISPQISMRNKVCRLDLLHSASLSLGSRLLHERRQYSFFKLPPPVQCLKKLPHLLEKLRLTCCLKIFLSTSGAIHCTVPAPSAQIGSLVHIPKSATFADMFLSMKTLRDLMSLVAIHAIAHEQSGLESHTDFNMS